MSIPVDRATIRAEASEDGTTTTGGGLARYAVRRLLTAIGTLVFVLVFNFVLFRLLPGDPAALYTRGRNVDAASRRRMQEQLNADKLHQFLTYVKNPFSTDFRSAQFSRPVWDVIGSRVWPTLLLLGISTILSTIIGIWIGIRGGWRRGRWFDRTSTGATLTLYAMPEFWLGMILLIVFSTGVGPFPGIFPSGGEISPGVDGSTLTGVVNVAWHLVLPVTTLTLIYLAEYSLVMRASLVEEMGQDYLRTARAKGLMDRMVRRRHAVPNALLPTITLVFLNIGFIVSGAITVETVYSWPGLGQLSFEAIRGPDIALLQAIFLLFSITVVVFNAIADVVVAAVDPRVRT
jgi:peptide/nickel transport system permease protein